MRVVVQLRLAFHPIGLGDECWPRAPIRMLAVFPATCGALDCSLWTVLGAAESWMVGTRPRTHDGRGNSSAAGGLRRSIRVVVVANGSRIVFYTMLGRT